MKIICTKNEFALLVRACQYESTEGTCCDGCLFSLFCGDDESEFAIMNGIEDICEVEAGG